MSLRERLEAVSTSTVSALPAEQATPRGTSGRSSQAYQELKSHLHKVMLERLDLEAMESLTPDRLQVELRTMVEGLLQEENIVINDQERRSLVRDVQYEMVGLGPLEPLLADPTISDILVNNASQVYVERSGRIEQSEVSFVNDAHLMKIIDKIVSRVGRRIDESSPMVDARLPDGSRVNAIVPPLSLDGPVLSIRRFAAIPLTMDRLISLHTLVPEMAELLAGLIRAKLNVLISGGTGSGKTTLLNILSSYIPGDERIITIEDAAELQLQQPHVVRLETRPANIEGRGEVTQRALVRNALRMRPDRIILGEVRGAEAFDMLQAMNTGHEGSMSTVHANSPRDALMRLENMLGMAGVSSQPRVMRSQIASAINVVVQVQRLRDGKRKLISLQEVTGMEGDVITMQEIFSFRQTGMTEAGEVQGFFSASGVRPKFSERLRAYGITLADSLFDPGKRFD
ncbi:CpaF family protein [Uliginosibacterium aquaticum]|uniref:CpaF family protein n=1 Tax=Uliginosibacterium aquaticum TaxID=2731212 RepID=A0ABX2IDT3_9RHOO|nr:CpaF family protein [Uliginosibacterium aquaticum]NSL54734.1 CpaF family protein [Uliginosibacterium aquaticum]